MRSTYRAIFALSFLLAPGCPGTSETDAGTRDTPSAVDAPTAMTDTPARDDAPVLVVDAPSGTDAPVIADAPPAADAGRTRVIDRCARALGSCTQDSDCMAGGCGGELCASESAASTCDCTAPAGSCGCLDGSCGWYL